jgi:hypothetical protein
MRITPYFLTPCAFSNFAMRQAFFTANTNFSCASGPPKAVSPTVPGHTGATSEPTASPFAAILSAITLRSSSEMSMFVCGSKRKRSTPSNFVPFTSACAVMSSIVSRSMNGSAPGLPLPTRPGHMAL